MKHMGLVLIVLVVALGGLPVAAQDDDCSPEAVETWFLERQTWRNATSDVFNTEELRISQARLYLFEHLDAIADLERPSCLDEAMLWTYYGYNAYQRILACHDAGDLECVGKAQKRRDLYNEQIARIMEKHGFIAEDHLDVRPEGWGLTTDLNATPEAEE